MKKNAVALFLLLSLFVTGCASPGTAAYRRVSMQEAVDMMADEAGYIILDVRTAQEFASGHIPGAMLLPNEDIGTEEIAQLPDKSQLILVYCRSGNRSKQATRMSWLLSGS